MIVNLKTCQFPIPNSQCLGFGRADPRKRDEIVRGGVIPVFCLFLRYSTNKSSVIRALPKESMYSWYCTRAYDDHPQELFFVLF